jgi:hypothetical protein
MAREKTRWRRKKKGKKDQKDKRKKEEMNDTMKNHVH